MSRHGMIQLQAEGAPPPATDPRAPKVPVAADRLTKSLVRDRLDRVEEHRSGLSVSITTPLSTGCADADIGRRSKSP